MSDRWLQCTTTVVLCLSFAHPSRDIKPGIVLCSIFLIFIFTFQLCLVILVTSLVQFINMSISSCYSLHMPFDRESMPMSDDHVPLPGDTDFVPLSEEDMTKLFAAHQSGETSPEVRAQLDALFEESDELMRSIINEDMLAGPADAHVDK
ncbi:hypothetical protein BDR06DRAFT_723760 [Suillus hirtellus]|nr:hypothetical protein BDR06DRAFT_723760 [Suillus hirtellus]